MGDQNDNKAYYVTVGNIPHGRTKRDLMLWFRDHGPIDAFVEYTREHQNPNSTKFHNGWVKFDSQATAEKLCDVREFNYLRDGCIGTLLISPMSEKSYQYHVVKTNGSSNSASARNRRHQQQQQQQQQQRSQQQRLNQMGRGPSTNEGTYATSFVSPIASTVAPTNGNNDRPKDDDTTNNNSFRVNNYYSFVDIQPRPGMTGWRSVAMKDFNQTTAEQSTGYSNPHSISDYGIYSLRSDGRGGLSLANRRDSFVDDPECKNECINIGPNSIYAQIGEINNAPQLEGALLGHLPNFFKKPFSNDLLHKFQRMPLLLVSCTNFGASIKIVSFMKLELNGFSVKKSKAMKTRAFFNQLTPFHIARSGNIGKGPNRDIVVNPITGNQELHNYLMEIKSNYETLAEEMMAIKLEMAKQVAFLESEAEEINISDFNTSEIATSAPSRREPVSSFSTFPVITLPEDRQSVEDLMYTLEKSMLKDTAKPAPPLDAKVIAINSIVRLFCEWFGVEKKRINQIVSNYGRSMRFSLDYHDCSPFCRTIIKDNLLYQSTFNQGVQTDFTATIGNYISNFDTEAKIALSVGLLEEFVGQSLGLCKGYLWTCETFSQWYVLAVSGEKGNNEVAKKLQSVYSTQAWEQKDVGNSPKEEAGSVDSNFIVEEPHFAEKRSPPRSFVVGAERDQKEETSGPLFVEDFGIRQENPTERDGWKESQADDILNDREELSLTPPCECDQVECVGGQSPNAVAVIEDPGMKTTHNINENNIVPVVIHDVEKSQTVRVCKKIVGGTNPDSFFDI